MKSLISALLLFLAVVGAITLNSIFLQRTCDTIKDTVSAIPYSSKSDELMSELESLWGKRNSLVGLSVKADYVDRMSELIISLSTAIKEKDQSEIQRVCQLITEHCESIAIYERISLHSLF